MTQRTSRVVIAAAVLFGVVGIVLAAVRLAEYRRARPVRAGISALKAGDFQTAHRELRPYAEAGNGLASRTLGEMYAFGWGVPIEIQAAMWFRLADCSCSAPGTSEYDIAFSYLHGNVVTRDVAMAAKWMRRAAEAGNPEAQRMLADRGKLNALGLPIDSAVSDYWRKIAR
jgi:TPR repeat protein